jgi:hypothetical protein
MDRGEDSDDEDDEDGVHVPHMSEDAAALGADAAPVTAELSLLLCSTKVCVKFVHLPATRVSPR